MCSEEIRRIEVGTPGMQQAFEEGLSPYQPLFGDLDLELECRSTRISLSNLRKVAGAIPEPVSRIVVRPRFKALVVFGSDKTYLVTGFGYGYSGEGPHGLVEFAAEQGFGSGDYSSRYEENSHRVFELPEDFEGVIFSRLYDSDAVESGAVSDQQPSVSGPEQRRGGG